MTPVFVSLNEFWISVPNKYACLHTRHPETYLIVYNRFSLGIVFTTLTLVKKRSDRTDVWHKERQLSYYKNFPTILLAIYFMSKTH